MSELPYGGMDIITSPYLPDDKFYLVGNEIVMSVKAYKRPFGWEALAGRVKRDFRYAQAEFDRAFSPGSQYPPYVAV